MGATVKSVLEDALYEVAVLFIKTNMALGRLEDAIDLKFQERKCAKCSRKSCRMRVHPHD